MKTSLPSPKTARVYVNLPEGNSTWYPGSKQSWWLWIFILPRPWDGKSLEILPVPGAPTEVAGQGWASFTLILPRNTSCCVLTCSQVQVKMKPTCWLCLWVSSSDKKKESQRRIDFWAPAAPLQIVAPPPLILTYPSSGPQCVASNSAGFRKTPGGIYWEYVKDIYIYMIYRYILDM